MSMLKPKIFWNCKLEKDFQWQLTSAYKKHWCFCFKIPDNSMTPKPYDMILVTPDGVTYHVELKITKDLSINVNNLRPNQRSALWAITSLNKDAARVFVYSTKNHEYYCMKYSEFREAANDKRTVKLFNSTWLIEKN